jgi:GxxExxY protein
MHENDIATLILDAAFEIHKALGPGLLESVYEEALFYELTKNKGLQVDRQRSVPVVYKDVKLEIGFRADLIVENKVLIELKSIEKVTNVHKKQTLTYIRLAEIKLGLLINFNESLLKNGITRIANNL